MGNLNRESSMALTEKAGMGTATAQRNELLSTLKKIMVDLEGGGNILDILKNVRFNNVLPGLVNQLTKPGFIGNQSGNLSGQLDPNFLQDFLNDDQRAIAQ